MKLSFSIAYKAEWGQMLSVAVSFCAADGYQENFDLPMSTSDGYHWYAEMGARKNHQHTFVALHYYYKVVNEEGNLIRQEYMGAPRLYAYDSSKSFDFPDAWLDNPHEAEELLAAKPVASVKQKKEEFRSYEVPFMPFYSRTMVFYVQAPDLHEGEAVALLGNHPMLGLWNTDHFLQMEHAKGNCWVLSVDVQPINEPIEYKYVVYDAKTLRFKRWEYGDNRTTGNERLYDQDVCVLHGGRFRTKQIPPQALFNFQTYIFDLDGTLLSTLADLAASCNFALRSNGLPERTIEEVRRFVGNGVKKLMQRAVGDLEDEELFDKVFADFRRHYMIHNLDTTKPYPGIMEMLSSLKARGKNIAVVSNKFYAATQALCQHFFGNLVDVAIGEREDIRKKPAPDTVNEALKQLHADRKTSVYIGDSDVDVMTAENSGMPCISVLWGFRDLEFLLAHGANILVSSPLQLL